MSGPKPTARIVRLADFSRTKSVPDANEAVNELNRRFGDGGLDAALDVGNWVLDAWFEGDAAVFRANSRTHPEFRGLASHPSLGMSYSFLWNAVAVAEQYAQLPRQLARQLTLAHHRVLLPVRDPDLKQRLAQRVVEEGLSKRQLIRYLQEGLGQRNKRGRKPLPAFVKGMRAVRRGIDQALAEPVDRVDLEQFGLQETELVLRDLARDISELNRLAAALHRHIGRVKHAM